MTENKPTRSNMRLRYGINRVIEEEADRLIYEQVRQIKKHSENDILTPWKEKDRRKHEVYVSTGVPDAANRLGIYHRTINTSRPDLNSREGPARGLTHRVPRTYDSYSGDSLHNFVHGEDS